jgi:hypothetical protein
MSRATAALTPQELDCIESFSYRSIAYILWQIFVDTRQLFSTPIGPNGETPQTMLAIA